jgi:hypothetical protein
LPPQRSGKCDTTTSHNPDTVEVFDGGSDPASPRRIATLLREDAGTVPWVTALTVAADGVVTVTAAGVSATSPLGCSDLTLTDRYQVTGGTAKRLSRDAAPVKGCVKISG